MFNKLEIKEEIKKLDFVKLLKLLIALILGSVFLSTGIVVFMKPHTIAAGGVSGLAILMNKLFGTDLASFVFIVGVILITLSIKILGFRESLKTFIATSIFSKCLAIMMPYGAMHLTSDPLLAAIAGGIFSGIGLGIMFKVNASTGGTDLIALMLSKIFKNLKVTEFLLFIDGSIVISSGFVNHNFETALYSGLALFLTMKSADVVIEGLNASKACFIISNNAFEIKNAIISDLGRTCTIVNSKGGYTNESKELILVVVSKKQIQKLKTFVHSLDNKAFIIVYDVHEVLGEGFSKQQ